LLDNGSVTTFPVFLSGRLTRSSGNEYIKDCYHRNESLNSRVSAVTNTLAAIVSELREIEGFDKVFSARLTKDCLKEMQTQIGTIMTVKTDADVDTDRVSKKEEIQTKVTQEDGLSKK
jgi:hypothetical protein